MTVWHPIWKRCTLSPLQQILEVVGVTFIRNILINEIKHVLKTVVSMITPMQNIIGLYFTGISLVHNNGEF